MRRHLKWRGSDSIFLSELDAEHRAIFQAGAGLQDAVERGASRQQVTEAIRGALAVVEDHFTHEERLMQAARYLSFAWHKAQHDTVRKRLKEFSRRFSDGEAEAAPLMLEFLEKWLHDHFSVADRMLASHLRNRSRSGHAA